MQNQCPPCPPQLPPCVPQVMMYIPPSICVPTQPAPVRPLQLPQKPKTSQLSDFDKERFRYNNFYNSYNIDYHNYGIKQPKVEPKYSKADRHPYCENYEIDRRKNIEKNEGCPTGFKPCTFKMIPPPCGNPNLPWIGQVQPCPPKPKRKNDNRYIPEPCTKLCCKHWKPKQPPCIYDRPCKAHCYNQPREMRAIWHEFSDSNSRTMCH